MYGFFGIESEVIHISIHMPVDYTQQSNSSMCRDLTTYVYHDIATLSAVVDNLICMCTATLLLCIKHNL